MFVYMHVDTHSWELIRICVCACESEDGGGGVEWLHQYSELAPYEECVGGGKEGGWYWWWVGQPFLRAEQCNVLEQSSSTGGLLDWPGPVRGPRPAKMQGAAPVQTRELAALFCA